MSRTISAVSRRQFVLTSLAAGAGLLLTRRSVHGQASAGSEDRLALLSDTHINAKPDAVERDVNMSEHLRLVVEQILAMEADRRPTAAIHSGDCAHRKGVASDYIQARSLLRPLIAAGIPVHVAMGNYDDRQAFPQVFAGDDPLSPSPLEGRRVGIVSLPRADWIVLDGGDKTDPTPGQLGEAQIAWLKSTLDAGRGSGKPVMVLIHHSPNIKGGKIITPPEPPKTYGLIDTQALFDVIAPDKRVKALVHGHTHKWGVSKYEDLHIVNLPAVGYVLSPTNPAAFSAWTYCRVSDQGMTLQLHCIDPAHANNGKVTELSWRPDA